MWYSSGVTKQTATSCYILKEVTVTRITSSFSLLASLQLFLILQISVFFVLTLIL